MTASTERGTLFGDDRNGGLMTAEQVAQLLAATPLFADLDPEIRLAVARYGDEAAFAEGRLLAHEGAPADRFYVLLQGEVALEVHDAGGGPLSIETLAAPDVVGWSWLMPPYRWHFDVRAISAVRAVAIEAEALRVAMSHDDAVGFTLMTRFARVLLQRLQATRLRLLDVYQHPAAR
jgi:CRP-like cAMP-binding protein